MSALEQVDIAAAKKGGHRVAGGFKDTAEKEWTKEKAEAGKTRSRKKFAVAGPLVPGS